MSPTSPTSRIAPLPMGSVPGLEESFDRYRKALGFVPIEGLVDLVRAFVADDLEATRAERGL